MNLFYLFTLLKVQIHLPFLLSIQFQTDWNQGDLITRFIKICQKTQTRGRCSSLKAASKLKTFFSISVPMAWLGYPSIKLYWVLVIAISINQDRFFKIRQSINETNDLDVSDKGKRIKPSGRQSAGIMEGLWRWADDSLHRLASCSEVCARSPNLAYTILILNELQVLLFCASLCSSKASMSSWPFTFLLYCLAHLDFISW